MKRLSAPHVLVCICLALTCFMNVAYGDITTPPGLNPGDTFHWVFVTSTTRDATSIHIGDYNQFVQEAANASPQAVTGVQGVTSLGEITWKAIASTVFDLDARINIGNPADPIYLLNGDLVAHNEHDLWDGSISTPINITELLDPADLHHTGEPFVWTGTYYMGFGAHPLGVPMPTVGYFHRTDTRWVYLSGPPAFEEFPLYAISGPLTVAEIQKIPLPASLVLVGIGIGCVNLLRRRRTL